MPCFLSGSPSRQARDVPYLCRKPPVGARLFEVANTVLGSHDWWTSPKVRHDLLDRSCPSELSVVFSVTIDPNLGGCTRVQGGVPTAILLAGKLSLPKMHIRRLCPSTLVLQAT